MALSVHRRDRTWNFSAISTERPHDCLILNLNRIALEGAVNNEWSYQRHFRRRFVAH